MEIISQSPIFEPPDWVAVSVFYFTAVALLVLLVMLALMLISFKKFAPATTAVTAVTGIAAVIVLIIVAILSWIFRVDSGYYRYEARVVDDTYSVNELFEKYENITCEDGIYYFEDRRQ